MKMSQVYREINFLAGSTVEDAVKELLDYKEKGLLVCGEFNGVTLYSDTVTMDRVYKEITGKTKAEFDESQRKRKEEYNRKEREHIEKIPELTKVWQEKGRKILTKDKWGYWDEIVPIRLGDLYQGMELGNCLEIVEVLNNGGELDKAKELIMNQGHSGMSFGLVSAMVKEFSERGSEFVKYVMS
jgi:hypothetical protein